MSRTLAILVLLGVGSAACGSDDGDEVVRVFAAASLTGAFGELADAFEAASPGVTVELNVAGSSSLREQILQGAPADVFASADEANMAELIDAVEVDGPPRTFATNRITIGVPSDNPGGVVELADLADDELLVGLCAAGVPCGDLARTVLESAGVEAAVDTNEPNVRALAAKLADGELDAGLVYVTEVAPAGELLGVPVPSAADAVTRYSIVVLDGAATDADGFVEFVLSPAGQAILAEYGFGAP
ncbi:MAG: molybdate ABC transporter substrate-binding protein [Ilumatobacteraceae bacterium]